MLDFSTLIRERTEHFVGRDWVFRAVNDWLGRPDAPRVFLLSGDPGTGKTAVAARLVQMSAGEVDAGPYPHLADGRITHHHFCQATLESTLSPLTFVQALSEQLANRYPAFQAALERAASHQMIIRPTVNVTNAMPGSKVTGAATSITIEIKGSDARGMFDEAVRRPLQALEAASPGERIVILVDSLDEALLFHPENNIAQLLKLASDFPPGVRFILTCRTKSDRVFEIIGQPTLDLVGDAPQRLDEVNTYVVARLEGIAEPARSTIARRVADASKANFLYAYHVLNDLLARGANIEQPDALELPPTLEDVYRQFLKRELAANPPRWNDVYRPLLGSIAVARGAGLTKAQLIGITQLAEDTANDVLKICRQYLAGGEKAESPYRIYHQSFRDFLLRDETYSVYPAERHAALARYLQDRYGGSWGQCKDEYALRYTPVHWAEAAIASENQREVRTQTLIELVSNPKYQRQVEKQVSEPPLLQQHLERALRVAALNDRVDMLPWLLRAVQGLTGFRTEFLRGESVVTLAKAGKVDQAGSRLSLFDAIGSDWQAAAQLIVAWLASERNPAAAQQLRDRLSLAGAEAPAVTLLRDRLDAALRGEAVFAANSQPPGGYTLEVGAQLVKRLSGQAFDQEMLGAINPSLIVPIGTIGTTERRARALDQGGYTAASDTPILVALAQAWSAEGTALVDEYIDAHAGYNYIEYRNESLWLVLATVLSQHPDQSWVRDRLGKILIAALTGGGVDFREMLPLTADTLLVRAREQDSHATLNRWCEMALGAAQLLQSRTDANDSWGNHKRRLTAVLELYALVLDDRAMADRLLRRIGLPGEVGAGPPLPYGFAGFQAPANLRLADALRAAQLDAPARLDAALLSAFEAAHNVQDYHFAARVTARCNALARWHRTPLAGPALTDVIARLVNAPSAAEFSADHQIGEPYSHRRDEPSVLRVDPARFAVTLEALVEVFQRPAVEFRRVNPKHALTTGLPNGTLVRVPDPGLPPLLAVHLAARAIADGSLMGERSELVRSLVPVAASNPTALDTLLSYLLIASAIDDEDLMEEIVEAAGPVAFSDPAVPLGQIGPDALLPA
jgi:hypothetical protein